MKRSIIQNRLFLLLLTAIILFSCACSMPSWLPEKVVDVSSKSASVGAPNIVLEGDHPSNNKQYESTAWIGTYGGRLLFYQNPGRISTINRTRYTGWLCVFGDRGIQKKCHLAGGGYRWNHPSIFGSVGKYLYYTDGNDKLMCCDLESFKEKTLCKGQFRTFKSEPYWAEDGSVYFPLHVEHSGDPTLYIHVQGDTVLGEVPLEEGYPLGESTYYTDYGYAYRAMDVIREDGNGNREVLLPGEYGGRSVIPTEYGLLVHNLEATNIIMDGIESEAVVLHHINEMGEISPLFQVDCLQTISAVAVNGSYAYLSFQRGMEWGDFSMISYADDPVAGTYRINLEDQTYSKINDKYYRGLYIFDDSYIYACDEEGGIYQLDFDGNVVETLFQVR